MADKIVIRTISEMKDYLLLNKGRSVGFVPTMGYLHDGHMSLVRKSVSESDITVVSIYVNPTQFGTGEDFDKYPQDIDRDLVLLFDSGVDAVFCPEHAEMYPKGFSTFVEAEKIGARYCGASRPGHFRGVATIVLKLVNIVMPKYMYMGEKDFQQIFILEQMLKDLNHGTIIVRCPIVRESDGLAMSSRNVYLSEAERKKALCLYDALLLSRNQISSIDEIKCKMSELIANNDGAVDYIAFVNENTFEEEDMINDDTRVLLAVRIGKTRLIDNMKCNKQEGQV
jgi:pantoate--beta-alanine ligase